MAGFFKLALVGMWIWFITSFWIGMCSGTESDGHSSSDILFLPFHAKSEVEMGVGMLLSGLLWCIIVFSYLAPLIMGVLLGPIFRVLGWKE